MSGPPVRVGVIGTGALGFHHARLLRRMPGISFAGIYDKNPARAAEVAAQLETVAHEGLAALLERVDAVTVAVPTPAHAEVGIAVLERGIALLMEKPLADTVAGAEALVRGAAARGAVLQVGHVERFNRAVRAAAPYLDEPRFLQIDRLAPFQPRGADVAVMLDLMIHDLDLVLELVRAPVTDVRATGVAILTPHVDIANARLEFANGAIANLTASRVSRERTRKLRIFQPTGYCSLDLAQGSGDFFRLKPGWQTLGATTLEQIVEHVRLEAPEAEPLKLELESFLRAVRGEEDVVVSGAAGAQALALAFRVAAAIQASPLAPPAPPTPPTRSPRSLRRHAAVSRAPRIYISAGEPSGDAHAAAVVTALKRRLPGATVEAFGGPDLEAAGAAVLDRMEQFSVVGFVEALWKLPAHLRLLRRVRLGFQARRYDLVILVDYPGYHLRVAAEAAAAGIPVLYYIAPQMWAWAPGRVRKLAAVRRLAVILPFEEAFFRERGVAATFVGHPLKDRMPPPPRADARRRLGLDPARPVLGLFPGSRAQEVKRLWPAFRDAAARVLAARPDVQVVVAGTPRGRYPAPGATRLHMADPLTVFAAADAGLCKSGTTTLEAALADVPMVIAYRLNPVSFAIAIRMLQVPHVGLVNLIAGREVSPELLQGAVTPAALANAVLPLLDPDSDAARRQREGLGLVRQRLGPPGAADRVAGLALELAG